MKYIFSLFFYITCSASIASEMGVSTQELSLAAFKNISRVPEFAYIQKAAEEIGVKVYLFGGSAAAYAHYVRWYIELQNGSENHQPERFDFDYTNIYRGNQDLDLVVDGNLEQAREFQSLLRGKYAHIVGEKDDWEVRLLQEKIGDKLPLLNDKNFQSQHTDTNSTGMLDLTAKKGDPVFRDLLDWENTESQFLQDVAGARITYLFNKKHNRTARYLEGKNPPIFSAIRYLAKLTQYEVEGRAEDLETIKQIIEDTKFNRLSAYVRKKIGEFAIKTLLNSPDSEYAWNLMDDLGLRKQLIKMDEGKANTVESLSWWMNKEPLRSKPLGKKGRTAKEIFNSDEIIVSHETNSFQAYENITRSSRGEANAFISRQLTKGEAAVHGNGFYTKVGMKGAIGNGLTIRFKLHPEAREHEDFVVVTGFLMENGSYVIVKNKNALTLIQENININLTDFLRLINENSLGKNDLGLVEKLKRKFKRVDPKSDEFQNALKYIETVFFIADDFPEHVKFDFSQINTSDFDSLIKDYTNSLKKYFKATLPIFIKKGDQKLWQKHPHWISRFLEINVGTKELITHVLNDGFWSQHPEFIESLFSQKKLKPAVIEYVLSQKGWEKHAHIIEDLIDRGQHIKLIIEHVLSQPHWGHRFDLIERLLKKVRYKKDIIEHVLSQSHMVEHIKTIEQLIEQGDATLVIEHIFSKSHWNSLNSSIQNLYEENPENSKIIKILIEFYFSQPHSLESEAILEKIVFSNHYPTNLSLIEHAFSKEHWSHRADLVRHIYETKSFDSELFVKNILSQPFWSNQKDFIMELSDNSGLHKAFAFYFLSKPHSKKYSEVLQKLYTSRAPQISSLLLNRVLSQEHWSDQKEYVKNFMNSDKFLASSIYIRNIIRDILSKPYWADTEILDTLITKIESLGQTNFLEMSKLLFKEVFALPHGSQFPQQFMRIVSEKTRSDAYTYVLSKPHWFKNISIYKGLVEDGYHLGPMISEVLSQEAFPHPSPLTYKIAENQNYYSALVNSVLIKPQGLKYVDLAEKIISQSNVFISSALLKAEIWAAHPEFIVLTIEKYQKSSDKNSSVKPLVSVFREEHWKNHPVLKSFTGREKVSLRNMLDTMKKTDFSKWYEDWKKSTPLTCASFL